MLQGFKDFISRGNAIDLAVGVIIGAAFGAVVTALVDNVLNPLVGGIFGQPDLDRIWVITMRAAEGEVPATEILVGTVLTALINFLLVAVALYFAVVVPMNKLAERRAKGEEPAPEAPAEDIALLTEIRDLLAKNKA
ncbi:large conductance mechanosensitive channel protein MscL [Ruania halotolerans]|uniref:large conductance mechanosensitive channel protein MscL n=1 Tax=Ruania halotolerans TaxID=2897773 RepID=UPI001E5E2D94|nr:large conductance mechanosensitive channel protein MscL [Ruania halotolerans]UFU07302.1 large conductance mechanosensitive channel protein MscL [Ruania halotolerans]